VVIFIHYFICKKKTFILIFCNNDIGVILNLNSAIVSPVPRNDFNIYINNYLKSCLNYDIENAANEAKEIASNIVRIYDLSTIVCSSSSSYESCSYSQSSYYYE